MFFNKKKNLYETIKLTYYYSKFFGLCQITLDFGAFNDIQRYRTTFLDISLMVFWCSILGQIFVVALLTPYDLNNYTSAILLIGTTFSGTSSSLVQALIPPFNFYHRWKFVRIIHKIHLVDEKVRKFMIYNKNYCLTILLRYSSLSS